MDSAATTASATLYVPALDCPEELSLIEKGLRRLPGIVDLAPDYLNRRLIVEHDVGLNPLAIAAQVRQIGFSAEVLSQAALAAAPPRTRLRQSTLAGAALLLLAFAAHWLIGWLAVANTLAIAATVVAGANVARAGWRALRLRALDMNALMTLAAAGALASGDYFEAATAMVLFGVSLWLESFSLTRAQAAVRSLVELVPPQAHCYQGHDLHEVEAASIVPGDLLLIKPGERVPVDGDVEDGASSVNQSLVTGEAIPVDKQPGMQVYAGSVNGEGALVVRARRAAADSTVAHIARLVEEAQRSRSPTERFVDRFARYYTPAVIALALALAAVPLAALAWHVPWAESRPAGEWVHRALVLLVIACPCALVISTPVTIVCGLQAAARSGILVKGGEFLERAGQIGSLAFDKTGTVTLGTFGLSRVLPAPGVNDEELLLVAAAIESGSEHPLAQAIVQSARHRAIEWKPATNVAALRGYGVRGEIDGQTFYAGNWSLFCQPPLADSGTSSPPAAVRALAEPLLADGSATVVLVGSADRFLGALTIEDRPRADALESLAELRRLRIEPLVMLSGDREAAVGRIAQELQFDGYHAGLLPEEKVAQVKDMLAAYPRLAMVGDGVNDAPALAAAWLGIALGRTASDTTLETADVVVLSPQLRLIPTLVRLGRRTRAILGQNISLALGLKAVVLFAAVAGHENLAKLWLAVAADVGATLLVVANGMRLLRLGRTARTDRYSGDEGRTRSPTI